MSQHKYRLGQNVYYSPSIRYAAQRGIYKIVGLSPDGYRIRHSAEAHDRTAKENELAVATTDQTDPLLVEDWRGRSSRGKWQ